MVKDNKISFSFIFLFFVIFFIQISFCNNNYENVLFVLKHKNLAEMEEFLFNELSNPLSKNYGKYLSVNDISNIMGRSNEEISFIIVLLLPLNSLYFFIPDLLFCFTFKCTKYN